jgi:hypothetical protein
MRWSSITTFLRALGGRPASQLRTAVTEERGRRVIRVASGDRPKRVLVVVDRAIVDVDSVPPSVLLAERQAEEVFVITPVLTSRLEWLADDDGRATAEATRRLASVLTRMRHEQGIVARGRVGDESPLTSIDDALLDFPADEIVITVNSDRHRQWHERHLAEKIRRRYPQPLIEVVVEADGAASRRF